MGHEASRKRGHGSNPVMEPLEPRLHLDATWIETGPVTSGIVEAGRSVFPRPSAMDEHDNRSEELVDTALLSPPGAASLQVGVTVRTTSGLNVRTGPGAGYPEITDPDYISHAPQGMLGSVVDGPVDADGYTWWKVDFGIGLYTGWSAGDWLEVEDRIEGIDASYWQGSINWNQVFDAGKRFAFVKATEGQDFTDPTFATNVTGAQAAGLYAGAYHFATPDTTPNDAVLEAQYFASVAGPYMTDQSLRPVLDLESGLELGASFLTQWTNTWMQTVEASLGVEPILYASSNVAEYYLGSSVTQYDLWVAQWTGNPDGTPDTGIWPDWSFWQYANSLSVPGVSGAVCGNVVQGGFAELVDYVVEGASSSPRIVSADRDGTSQNLTGLSFTFSEDVSASLSASDLRLYDDIADQWVDMSGAGLSYDGATQTAHWNLAGVALGPSHYVAHLAATDVTDAQGNLLDGNGDGLGGDDYATAVPVGVLKLSHKGPEPIPSPGELSITWTWPELMDDDAMVTGVDVHHVVTHSFVGDLDVTLYNEDETTWTLRDNEGGAGSGFDQTVSAPTGLFDGSTPAQSWTYLIEDEYMLSEGDLDLVEVFVYFEDPPAFEPYFFNVEVGGGVDQDGDGHLRQFDLTFDVDSDVPGNYYVFIYDTQDILDIVGQFSVNGHETDPITVTLEMDSYWDDDYRTVEDYTLEIYDSDVHLIGTYDKYNYPALGGIAVESSLEDSFLPQLGNVSITEAFDYDQDGYAREVTLGVEVLSQGTGRYDWELYRDIGPDSWGLDVLLYTSDEYNVSGSSSLVYPVSLQADALDWMTGEYDLQVKLYDAVSGQLVDNWTASDHGVLGGLGMERSFEDNDFNAWIIDAGIVSTVDEDFDTYWRQFDVSVDVDSNIPGDVYFEVYENLWFSERVIASSGTFQVDGEIEDHVAVTVVADDYNMTHWTRDLEVRLFDATSDKLLGVFGSAENPYLSMVRTELASQDQPFEPHLYDVRIAGAEDLDIDGYPRGVSVEADVDSNVPGEVYLKVYEAGSGRLLVESDAHSVTGSEIDYRGAELLGDSAGVDGGQIDLKIELYKAGNDELVETWTLADDEDLGGVKLEYARSDQPFEPFFEDVRIRNRMDVDQDGMSRSLTVEANVDGLHGSAGEFYIRMYDQYTQALIATSAVVYTSGDDEDYVGLEIVADDHGFTERNRDLRLEVHKASNHQRIQTWTKRYDEDLGGVGIESASEDEASVEPGDTLESARRVPIRTGQTAELVEAIGDGPEGDKDVDLYRITVTESVQLTADADAQSIGSGLDAYLRLFDEGGEELAFNDDRDGRDPFLTKFLMPGTYILGVSSRNAARYSPHREGSGASGSEGSYRVFVDVAAATPPVGAEVVVGPLRLEGDFQYTSGGYKSATGLITVNDILQISGSVSFNNDLMVWGSGLVEVVTPLGDYEVWDGEFDFNGSEMLCGYVNDAGAALEVVGIDLHASRIKLVPNGVEVRGHLEMPDVLGGLKLDIDNEHFVRVTGDGQVTYDAVIEIPSVELSFSGLAFEAVDTQIHLSNTSGTAEGIMTGLFLLDLPPVLENVQVDLTEASGNYFRVDAAGHVDLIGSIFVEHAGIAAGLYVDDLFVQLNTVDNSYYGEGMIGLPIGTGLEIGGTVEFVNGHLDRIGLQASNLNVSLWQVPPVMLQTIGCEVSGIWQRPIIISPNMALTAGPAVGGNALLWLDVEATVDLSGRVEGQAAVKIGNEDDPIAQGTMRAIWDKSYGVYLDGSLTVGEPSDPVLLLEGEAALGKYNSFQGHLRGVARVPDNAPIIGRWIGGQSISAEAYAQVFDDGRYSNDYIIGAIHVDIPLVGEIDHAVEVNLHNGSVDWNASLHRIREVEFPGVKAGGWTQGATASKSGVQDVFPVAGGVDWVILRAGWDTGQADLELLTPDGQSVTPANVDAYDHIEYVKSSVIGEAYYVVAGPAEGNWTLSINDVTGLGDVRLEHYQHDDRPAIAMLMPDTPVVSGGAVNVEWVDVDSDSDAVISLYYDTDARGADGELIVTDLSEDDPADSYSWSTADVPPGEYYVYAVIDDGVHAPLVSYAPGRVTVTDPAAPGVPTALRSVAVVDGVVELAWQGPAGGATVDQYVVRLTDDPAGETYTRAVASMEVGVQIPDLLAGETYRVAVAAIGADGTVGPDSEPILVSISGEAGGSEADGEWSVFASAGQVYSAKVPTGLGETVSPVALPFGATVDAEGNFQWLVPGSGATGWHEVLVHVTDAFGSVRPMRFQLLVDDQAPQWQGLAPAVEADSPSSLRVVAPAVEDASGAVGYRLYRDGQAVSDWQLSPTFIDAGLTPDTAYSYQVLAREASPAGRLSAMTGSASGRTLAAVPAGARVSLASPTTLVLESVFSAGNPSATEVAVYITNLDAWLSPAGTLTPSPAWQPADAWVGTVMTGLDSNARLELRLAARNQNGQMTDLSEPVAGRTLRENQPPSVTGLETVDGATTFAMTFSEPMMVDLKDVSLTGPAGPVDLSGASWDYVPDSTVATLTLAQALPTGWYTLELASGGAQDLAANALDGNGDGLGGDSYRRDWYLGLGGDADTDGAVDVSDLGILAGHWGTAGGARWADGDFSGDGAVDVSDLGILAGNWGANPQPAMPSTDPYEPVGAGLLPAPPQPALLTGPVRSLGAGGIDVLAVRGGSDGSADAAGRSAGHGLTTSPVQAASPQGVVVLEADSLNLLDMVMGKRQAR